MALQSEKRMALQSEDEVNNNEVIKYRHEIVWRKAITVLTFHALAILGAINFIRGGSSFAIALYFGILAILGSLGIQCGAHRLWSHRCYKANLPLRILLMILDTLALQEDIFDWCRDHRIHHKFSDTDADPYNSSRGFFFCHMGWVFVKKHPDIKAKGKSIDLSDLLADPVVRFQRRYYLALGLLFWGIIPIGSAMYFFNIGFFHAFCENCLRYVLSLHLTWTVNSVAHLYGMRPYDKSLNPRNSPLVIYWGLGEGYHNYHHVFPYDYSASEFGWKINWNPATAFIDFFHWIGWATDLKSAPQEVIKTRSERTGDKLVNTIENKHYVVLILDFITGFLASFSYLILLMCLRLIYSNALSVIYMVKH